MWNPRSFPRFQDAYLAVLDHVGREPEHVTASRGNRARECLNVSFVLDDPRDRLVYCPVPSDVIPCHWI